MLLFYDINSGAEDTAYQLPKPVGKEVNQSACASLGVPYYLTAMFERIDWFETAHSP